MWPYLGFRGSGCERKFARHQETHERCRKKLGRADVNNLLILELRDGDTVYWTALYDGRTHSGIVHIGADVGRLYALTIAIIQEHDIHRVSLRTPEHRLQRHRAVIGLAVLRCEFTQMVVDNRNKQRRSAG